VTPVKCEEEETKDDRSGETILRSQVRKAHLGDEATGLSISLKPYLVAALSVLEFHGKFSALSMLDLRYQVFPALPRVLIFEKRSGFSISKETT